MKYNWYQIIFITISLLLSGCTSVRLARIPSTAKIQINVPPEPFPSSRTELITFDLETDREIFFELYKTTRKVGMCSPTAIEEKEKAFEVMSVSFWGPDVEYRQIFNILRKKSGQWSTIGYGAIDIFDDPEGFPQYSYSRSALNKIKKWYEKNIPAEYQEVAKVNSHEFRHEYRATLWPDADYIVIGRIIDMAIVDSNQLPIMGEPNFTDGGIYVKKIIKTVNVIRKSSDIFPDEFTILHRYLTQSNFEQMQKGDLDRPVQIFGLDADMHVRVIIGHPESENIKTEKQIKDILSKMR